MVFDDDFLGVYGIEQGQATWGSRAIWCPRDILKVPSFKYPSSKKYILQKNLKILGKKFKKSV